MRTLLPGWPSLLGVFLPFQADPITCGAVPMPSFLLFRRTLAAFVIGFVLTAGFFPENLFASQRKRAAAKRSAAKRSGGAKKSARASKSSRSRTRASSKKSRGKTSARSSRSRRGKARYTRARRGGRRVVYSRRGRRGRARYSAPVASTPRAPRTPPRAQIPSDRVTEIQDALKKAGFYQGEMTGEYDSATREAMSAFQRANGIKETGMPTAHALAKLGLTKKTSAAGDTSAPGVKFEPSKDQPQNEEDNNQ